MKLVHFVQALSLVLGLTFMILYGYQVLYVGVGLWGRKRRDVEPPARLRRYAVLISARNEEGCIGQLIRSLRQQNYPAELLDIYILADNCTDHTAQAARAAGATKVYRRFDTTLVGKGYALDYLIKKLVSEGLSEQYEGYFVFDADNIVDENFVYEMNRTFDHGDYAALTCYRNSKNYGTNWLTAGYSIWFLREARFLNAARMALGTNCHVSGTGFLISGEIIREKGGWPYHLMTEDIQFSAECAAEGKRIGYCEGAIIFDEQPTTFRQSWDQRMRWSKGFYQVDAQYSIPLLKGVLQGGRKGLSCYDIFMTVAPGMLLSIVGVLIQCLVMVSCLSLPAYLARRVIKLAGTSIWNGFVGFYLTMFLYGTLTVFCEWKAIRATSWQKLKYLPVFPLFMITYLPISIAALFRKVEWKPIQHTALGQLDRAA